MSFAETFKPLPHDTNGFNAFAAFDRVEAAGEYQPLPAGVYQVRVVSGSFQQTKKNDDAYRIAFEVVEGPQTGRRVSRTWVFTAKALAYAKRDLAIFGFTISQQLLEPFPAMGRKVFCRLFVAVQRGDNGSEFNDVKKIDAVRFVDSAAKDFLIDPEQSEGGSQ